MATYQLVSSDSHIIEPADLWQERIDRPFRDRAPRLVHEAEADQESTLLRSRAIVERILQGVPDEEKAQIAGGNTARLYHFDAVY